MVYDTGGGRSRWLANWSISAIALLKTGMPFDVLSGSDAPGYGNVDGSQGDRPNVVDPSVLGRTIGNPDTSRSLLPKAAFSFMQPSDLRGNIGHNVFRKGGIRNVNAAIARSWKLGGDRSLTARAESINLFNTPQFAQPGSELTSPNFGLITNTLNDGRTIRFQLRLAFYVNVLTTIFLRLRRFHIANADKLTACGGARCIYCASVSSQAATISFGKAERWLLAVGARMYYCASVSFQAATISFGKAER